MSEITIAQETSNESNVFRLFSALPPELRLIVWSFAISDPQVIVLCRTSGAACCSANSNWHAVSRPGFSQGDSQSIQSLFCPVSGTDARFTSNRRTYYSSATWALTRGGWAASPFHSSQPHVLRSATNNLPSSMIAENYADCVL